MKNFGLTIWFAFLGFYALSQPTLGDDIDVLYQDIIHDGEVDYSLCLNDNRLNKIIARIQHLDHTTLSGDEQLAFYINAYNIFTIFKIATNYPISSVQDIPSFFDKKDVVLSDNNYSLNELEKDIIFNLSSDPRLHFALVCGAKGCPRIRAFAFRAEVLQDQLDQASREAMQEHNTLSVIEHEKVVSLSRIFSWYKNDFKEMGGVASFVKQHASIDLDSYEIKYQAYDWALNDYVDNDFFIPIANNSFRYISSATVPVGGLEAKVFNNLYSQNDRNNRATFFTMINSFVYGFKSNFNIGFDLRYRRVHNDISATSAFAVLGALGDKGRHGVTTIGPKIRWAPFPRKLSNFSIQSAFWFATGDDLEGTNNSAFIDWSSHTWITQFFNDKSLGDKFSLFTELDVIIEDIGADEQNRLSTPATIILSYFPIPNVTMYSLAGYSPFWSSQYDYFYQFGAGAKYQIHRNLEFEVLYTYFNNKFLRSVQGSAATYNFGIRYSRN